MKLNIIIAILLIVLCLLLVYVNFPQQKSHIIAGDTIQTVTCSDNQHTYAVYLPKNFDLLRKYRVMFCFDPGGNGTNAVEQFKYAGEKYNWILVGSNDAKNGPWNVIIDAQEAMLKDIEQRYNVDTTSYYAAGLSGGARMSYKIADNHSKQFKAIIPCGAGYGYGTLRKHVAVYHCIGDSDSNLDEVKTIFTNLKDLNVNTKLQVFSGGHEWPPEQVKKDAIDWIASL